MIGRTVYFRVEVKVKEYIENGCYKNTKSVVKVGVVLDKYRGSAQDINPIRDVFNYALVDFYLISVDEDLYLYHVLPKDIIRISNND